MNLPWWQMILSKVSPLSGREISSARSPLQKFGDHRSLNGPCSQDCLRLNVQRDNRARLDHRHNVRRHRFLKIIHPLSVARGAHGVGLNAQVWRAPRCNRFWFKHPRHGDPDGGMFRGTSVFTEGLSEKMFIGTLALLSTAE